MAPEIRLLWTASTGDYGRSSDLFRFSYPRILTFFGESYERNTRRLDAESGELRFVDRVIVAQSATGAEIHQVEGALVLALPNAEPLELPSWVNGPSLRFSREGDALVHSRCDEGSVVLSEWETTTGTAHDPISTGKACPESPYGAPALRVVAASRDRILFTAASGCTSTSAPGKSST